MDRRDHGLFFTATVFSLFSFSNARPHTPSDNLFHDEKCTIRTTNATKCTTTKCGLFVPQRQTQAATSKLFRRHCETYGIRLKKVQISSETTGSIGVVSTESLRDDHSADHMSNIGLIESVQFTLTREGSAVPNYFLNSSAHLLNSVEPENYCEPQGKMAF